MLLLQLALLGCCCLASSSPTPPRCHLGNILIQLKPYDFATGPGQLLTSLLQAGGAENREWAWAWRRSRRERVAQALKDHARQSQRGLVAELERGGMEYKSFWINNSLWVRQPPCHLQLLLLARFEAEGIQIIPDRIVAHIPRPLPSRTPRMDRLVALGLAVEGAVPWNLEMIGAPAAWRLAAKGKGVCVATIDTGVAYEHPALRQQYRGTRDGGHGHSWYDPQARSKQPDDTCGHGTHTMGTILGTAIGVAPEATWIAARGCTEKGCSQHDLLASAQWVMCPRDGEGGGGEERCDLGADIVSNSWGASAGDGEGGVLDWFIPAVDAWRAAGIIPVFAIGNEGPACGTAGAPATLSTVIGVGSIGASQSLSRFSSHGPGPSRPPYSQQKPELVAPGEGILSAAHRGGHVAMSGTSMATPHVAGAIAVMLSVEPALEYERILSILKSSCASKGLKAPLEGLPVCHAVSWDDYPTSFHYGAGLLNLERALLMLKDK